MKTMNETEKLEQALLDAVQEYAAAFVSKTPRKKTYDALNDATGALFFAYVSAMEADTRA